MNYKVECQLAQQTPQIKFSWNPSCSVRVILLIKPTNQPMGMKNLFDMRHLCNDGFQKSQHYLKLDPLSMIIPRTWRVCNCSVEWYVQTQEHDTLSA